MENLKFVTFHTDRSYGDTNGGARRANRLKIAEEVGFDLNRLFFSDQNEDSKYRGSVYILKPEDLANHEDLYAYSVYADTPKVTPATPGVAIGFNVSDAANIVAMNTKTMEATSTFCPGTHIDAKVVEGIASVTGGNPEDIIVDVSPFAHVLPVYNAADKNWMPGYINDMSVWEDSLDRDEKTGILYVNQLKAIKKQLLASGIKNENINFGEDSYYPTDENGNFVYQSSQRVRMVPDLAHPGEFLIDPETGTYLEDKSQDGRFMHGVALLDERIGSYDCTNIKTFHRK